MRDNFWQYRLIHLESLNEGYQVTIDVLQKLAVAHNINLEDYLDEVTRDMDII